PASSGRCTSLFWDRTSAPSVLNKTYSSRPRRRIRMERAKDRAKRVRVMPGRRERRRCVRRESRELAALLEKFLCCVGYCVDLLPQRLRNRRASEKVRPNALNQIPTATQTEIRASVGGLSDKLQLPEALGTRRALGDGVVPAIDPKENMLLRA